MNLVSAFHQAKQRGLGKSSLTHPHTKISVKKRELSQHAKICILCIFKSYTNAMVWFNSQIKCFICVVSKSCTECYSQILIHTTQNAFDSTYNAQDSAHNATCNKTKVNKTIQKVVDSAHNAT